MTDNKYNNNRIQQTRTSFKITKKDWLGYLLLSVAITTVGTIIACFLLVNYNLFMNNQLSVTDKILLVLTGTAASVVAGILNIRSIKALLNDSAVKKKYLKLIFLNSPLFIFQVLIFLAMLLVVGYD